MTGLMKIPTAEMQVDGTLMFGANYLPEAITPEQFNYNTSNYFFNITFIPFIEFAYRSTFIEWSGGRNQDRSFGLRLCLLKETKLFPSLVVGGNDLYTSNPGIESRYFSSLYGVATKNIEFHKNILGITLGIGSGGKQAQNLNGVFGGVSLNPAIIPSMRLMAEYDSHVFSAGAEVLILKHIYLFGMAYDLNYFAGGVAYRIYLNNRKRN